MFGDYYEQQDYQEKSPAAKAAGFAMWAGIAVVGTAAFVKSGLFRNTLNQAYSHIGKQGLENLGMGVVKDAFDQGQNVYSGEARALLNGLGKVGSSLISEMKGSRGAEKFVDQIKGRVEEQSLAQFEKISENLRSMAHESLKKGSVQLAKDHFGSSEFISDFTQLTKGIKFKSDSSESVKSMLLNTAENSYQPVTRDLLTNMMDSEANRGHVTSLIHKGADQKAKFYKLFDFLNTEKSKEVKFNDLIEHKGSGKYKITDKGHSFNKWAEHNLGIKATEGESFLDKTMAKFNLGLTDVLGDKNKSISNLPESQKKFIRDHEKRFMESHTGFIQDINGKFIPKAKIGDSIYQTYRKGANQLSIPLLPGAFQVNVNKLFNFMKADTEFVRNLGRAIAQPELRRAGHRFNSNMSLISIGEDVLNLDTSGAGTLTSIGKRMKVMPKRMSHASAEMARNRLETPLSYAEQAVEIAKGHNLSDKIKNALAGDPHDQTRLKKILMDSQHIWFTPEVGEGNKIVLTPNSTATSIGLDKKMINILGGPEVGVSDLNIINLKALLNSDQLDHNGEVRSEVSRRLIHIASTSPTDMTEFLSTQGDLLGRSSNNLNKKYGRVVKGAKKASDYYGQLSKEGLFSDDILSALKEHPSVMQAVETAKSDPFSFQDTLFVNRGLTSNLSQSLLGENVPTTPATNLMEELLGKVMEVHGELKMREEGVNEQHIFELHHKYGTNGSHTEGSKKLESLILKTFGLSSEFDNRSFLKSVTGGLTKADADGKMGINYESLSSLQRLMADPSDFKGAKGLTDEVSAKIVGLKSASLNQYQQRMEQDFGSLRTDLQNTRIFTHDTYEQLADHQEKMAKSEVVAKMITQRGNMSLRNSDTSVGKGSDYYLVESSFTPMDLLSNPSQALKNLKEDILGAGKGVFDVNAPLNYTGYIATVLGQMSNHLGVEAGLGLGVQDKMNLSRYLRAMTVKRALPAMVAYEAYRNFNSNSDDHGTPGLDDIGANARANISLNAASLSDNLNLTSPMKWLVDSFPGLDQYINPRSREEYEEWLSYGSEYVREGQGWLIGNKGALRGTKVSYTQPNYWRRGTSGWQTAAGISDPKYSFLPSLSHPFSPINRLTNPQHFVQEHKYDRPYIENGLGEDFGTKHALMQALYGGEEGEVTTAGQEGASGGGRGGLGSGGQGGPSEGGGVGNGGVGGSGEGEWTLWMPQHKIAVEGDTIYDKAVDYLDRYRQQSGLYGGLMKSLPFWPKGNELSRQHPSQAVDFRRFLTQGGYGEFLGPTGEYMRRVLGAPDLDTQAYSPYTNNQPSWLKDPIFHEGDPYTRVKGIGELVLPGPAFEQAHSWIHPMKARGSMIGKSKDEIIQTMLDPDLDEESNEYMAFGSEAHLMVQRKLKAAGILIAAEVPIYDAEHNISGTMDAVVNGSTGREVIDIKTQNAKDFEAGIVHEAYEDQLNFYLMQTGAHRGYLAFVNSSDPTQIRFHAIERDEERWERTVDRLEEARNEIRGMVNRHEISPYETYDVLARMTVLSKVSPHSEELEKLYQFVEQGGGGFNAQEKLIYQRLKQEHHEISKQYRTYTYRSSRTNLMVSKVLGVNADGSITTEAGNLRLAGVEWDRQAFNQLDPAELLGKYGVHEGSNLYFRVNGGITPNAMKDSTSAAIIGSINQNIIRDKYGKAMLQSDDPIDHQVMGGRRGVFRNSIEWLLHRDNIISNKIFRVRSATEQLERGEAYGTDNFQWAHPFRSLLYPELTSMVAKDPFTSGIMSGIGASFFVRKAETKSKVAMWAGGIMAAASTFRWGYEALSGKKWVAPRYEKQQEIDEYYDTLQFVKSASQAETIREKAFDMGYDLNGNPDGAPAQLQKAYYTAVEKAQNTMFAFDTAKGTLQQALKAIPFRHRQLAEEVALYADAREKNRFYKLLSSPEKRVLGKFLGVKENVPRPTLGDYFSKHFLPGPEWTGWKYNEDLSLYKRATSTAQHTLSEQVSKEDKAKLQGDVNIRIPNTKGTWVGFVREGLRSIQNDVDVPFLVDVRPTPADANDVHVTMDIRHDNRKDVQNSLLLDLKRI